MPPTTLWALLLLISTACGLPACALVSQFDPRPKDEAKEYIETIDPYLTQGQVYHGPATRLLVKALPLNPTVRKAIAAREAAAFGYGPARAAQRRQEMEELSQNGLHLVLAVYMPEKRQNKLAGRDAAWRVLLVNRRGQKLDADDRRRIPVKTTVYEAIYPFWGHWDRLYLFRFPTAKTKNQPFLQPEDQTAELLITGPPGKVALELRLK